MLNSEPVGAGSAEIRGSNLRSLADAIVEDQYQGYAYAYPHKTSYRPLAPPVSVSQAWAAEDRSRLFLYLHLPFCEMRCGFCNLFTTSQPAGSLVDQTLAAIERQSRVLSSEIGPHRVVQLAIGGGTPTYLSCKQLDQVLTLLRRDWQIAESGSVGLPYSVEVSPATVDIDKLQLLVDHGVRRISMGVQSFVERDLKQLGRPQRRHQVDQAIDLIRQAGVEVFNLDLIYGNQDQTETDWMATVDQALAHKPEELFLYPLYVRELTGLGRTGRNPAESRRHLYQLARKCLIENGYRQISMRMFRRRDVAYSTQHCCQEDGLVGLGPGARSYTTSLHYSTDFAVSGQVVRSIIGKFNQRDDASLATVDYGVRLSADDQRRRYLIRSLLLADGLDCGAFQRQYGCDVMQAFPQLQELIERGFAQRTPHCLRLNAVGLAYSDVIGPWLYSPAVRERMGEFTFR